MRFSLSERVLDAKSIDILRMSGSRITPEDETATFLKVISSLLVIDQPADRTEPAKKAQRYDLAVRLHAARHRGDTVDLTSDDVALINSLADRCPPLVFGRLKEFLSNPLPPQSEDREASK
jgi:ABC-type antimicrobial peptide transport system ATPase subunit